MTKPITPKDIVNSKLRTFPNFVIESFNECIAKNYLNGTSKVNQNEVIKVMISKMVLDSYYQNDKGFCRNQIFEQNYLDVEEIYHKNGWHVEYDKPGYNETYEPFFVFRKK